MSFSVTNFALQTPPNSASTQFSVENAEVDQPIENLPVLTYEDIALLCDYYFELFLEDLAAQEATNFQMVPDIDTMNLGNMPTGALEEIESPEYEQAPFTPILPDFAMMSRVLTLWEQAEALRYEDQQDEDDTDSDDELSLFEEEPEPTTANTVLQTVKLKLWKAPSKQFFPH